MLASIYRRRGWDAGERLGQAPTDRRPLTSASSTTAAVELDRLRRRLPSRPGDIDGLRARGRRRRHRAGTGPRRALDACFTGARRPPGRPGAAPGPRPAVPRSWLAAPAVEELALLWPRLVGGDRRRALARRSRAVAGLRLNGPLTASARCSQRAVGAVDASRDATLGSRCRSCSSRSSDQVRLTTVLDIGITALLIYWLFSLIRGTQRRPPRDRRQRPVRSCTRSPRSLRAPAARPDPRERRGRRRCSRSSSSSSPSCAVRSTGSAGSVRSPGCYRRPSSRAVEHVADEVARRRPACRATATAR